MISPNFTVEDIREVRRQLDDIAATMTFDEFMDYIRKGADECKRLMAERAKLTEGITFEELCEYSKYGAEEYERLINKRRKELDEEKAREQAKQ